ncbi:MAG: LCP family protein [Candidatus Spechtbacterales bacterium]
MKFIKSKTVLAAIGSLALFGVVLGVAWGLSHLAGSIRQTAQMETPADIKSPEKITVPSFKTLAEKTQLHSENGKTNILLLGISGEDYISGDVADTIILLSLEHETQKAYLFSLPRDLWISHDGAFQKINELYRLAGGTEIPDAQKTEIMKSKVREITGQNIHYSIVINLAGTEKVVDLIGGVETEEGHKNGEEALFYIRDRGRAGGDFDRMARQQKLIIAILEKISSGDGLLNEDKGDIIETYQEYFSTDISILQFLQIEPVLNKMGADSVEMYTITPTLNNLLYSDMTDSNGQMLYTLHPTAGYEDYSQIQSFIDKTLN